MKNVRYWHQEKVWHLQWSLAESHFSLPPNAAEDLKYLKYLTESQNIWVLPIRHMNIRLPI